MFTLQRCIIRRKVLFQSCFDIGFELDALGTTHYYTRFAIIFKKAVKLARKI